MDVGVRADFRERDEVGTSVAEVVLEQKAVFFRLQEISESVFVGVFLREFIHWLRILSASISCGVCYIAVCDLFEMVTLPSHCKH